jgi:hypothetical protein
VEISFLYLYSRHHIKIGNVRDYYLSFLTPQTGNTTLVKFGGRNITSPLKYLPSKKKKNERERLNHIQTNIGYWIQIFVQAMKI